MVSLSSHPSPSQLDLPDEKTSDKREQSPMDSSVSFSAETENMRMERLLGSLCQNDIPITQAGSSRGITDTPRGTPSVMDTARLKLQTNMADIKNMMTDIAHASHHVDHLSKAVESNRLPKGLTVEPRMMLVGANEDTEREWKEQTKINTLGYINVAKQHYARLIAQKTEAIIRQQTSVLECITDTSLSDTQRKALKRSYEDSLKRAEGEARAVKQERDQTSLAKLATEEDRPLKKQKTSDYQRYDSDHKYTKTYVTSQHSTAPQAEENTTPRNVDPPREESGKTVPDSKRARRNPKLRSKHNQLYKECLSAHKLHDNVVNLSSYLPTQTELNILSKGLTFIPHTRPRDVQINTEIENFIRKLRLRYIHRNTQTKHNPFRLKSKHIPKPTDSQDLENLINRIRLTLSQIHPTTGRTNLPRDGMSIIKKLSQQHDVIINTSDKGSTIVLLDREKYIEAGHKHLDDKQTYTRLPGDITDTTKKTITIKLDKLKEKNLLSKSHHKFCLPPINHRTSLMYFLIKLHKNPHAYRPICSCINSVTSNISAFLDHWLKQAVKLVPSYISDSTHFIKTIEKMTFSTDILLCSIDVTNMYTNIPIDEGNRAAIRALENMKCATDIPDMAVMKELLDMITHNNVFEFNGEHYIQIRGVPMGNIMAPSYSGIFMGELEKKLIEPGADKIKLWVRYIDDIFVVWQGPQTDFEHFVQQCNKLHPTIKFTSECSETEINFLDMTIHKGTNFQAKHTLDIKTYTKPTNTQAYVHASSFHPGGVGKSIALGESYRALRTNTDKVNFLQQIHKVQNALLSRGYDEKIIKPLIRRVRYKDRHTIIHKSKQTAIQTPGTPTMALTYNTHVSQFRTELNLIWMDVKKNPLLNELYPMPPRIALKKNRSLSNMLVSAKLKNQTPRNVPQDSQPFDIYQHCRVPANYPNNILKRVSGPADLGVTSSCDHVN